MSQEVFDNDGDHLGPNEGISSSFPDIMAAVEKGWAEIPSAAEIFLDQSEVSEVPATFSSDQMRRRFGIQELEEVHRRAHASREREEVRVGEWQYTVTPNSIDSTQLDIRAQRVDREAAEPVRITFGKVDFGQQRILKVKVGAMPVLDLNLGTDGDDQDYTFTFNSPTRRVDVGYFDNPTQTKFNLELKSQESAKNVTERVVVNSKDNRERVKNVVINKSIQ